MFLLLILGCFDDDPADCTTEAVISVSLSVLDPDGVPVEDAAVTWTSGSSSEDCELWPDGTYACGFEVEGVLDISIVHDDYFDQELSVEVGSDTCHVITEQVTAELEDLVCPDLDPGPSVYAATFYPDGTPHGDAEVWWGYPDSEPEPCELVGDDIENEFGCANGVDGQIGVWASSDGGYSEYAAVDIAVDECGDPVAEYLDIVLLDLAE